ncbi:MAG: leucyl/phenylalanyl-tRNA--protein transferase [Xanthomonadales bacterium]|nr:leucyl/phenylalanyl-tRNA--protein transferase [Xanthomonadales bacterium]
MIPWIPPDAPPDAFPPAEAAQFDPNGLLAAGGDLSPERLVEAYRRGIFPWYSGNQPILWWCPDPRTVLRPEAFHASRRLRRFIRSRRPRVRLDHDFRGVIRACAEDRPGQSGTWITPAMRQAYERLFRLGVAHCAEALVDGKVIGGVYGVAVGRVFFGESMYTHEQNGSKLALYGLCAWLAAAGWRLLDCQVESPHLFTLGAETWSRERFLGALETWCAQATADVEWVTEFDLLG